MTISVNDSFPSVTVKTVKNGEVSEVDSAELFSTGKKVLFAVPGAFTPTCSQAHLPGYVVLADKIKEKGIDEIICLSVNDAFVMKAWADASNASEITMLADGNAELTDKLGLVLDGSGFGMGKRSQRYAMIVENGKVTRLGVEPPKTFEESKAETILELL